MSEIAQATALHLGRMNPGENLHSTLAAQAFQYIQSPHLTTDAPSPVPLLTSIDTMQDPFGQHCGLSRLHMKEVNATTLRTEFLLTLVNQETLKRMEDLINAVNETTLGRMEEEIKAIKLKVGA